jgi:hypothetical protein
VDVATGRTGYRADTASGVFNTSRQIGGALAVVVFGVLLADQATFMHGLRTSLLIAAAVALAAAAWICCSNHIAVLTSWKPMRQWSLQRPKTRCDLCA